MMLQDHPFWSKLLLTRETIEITKFVRTAVQYGRPLNTDNMKRSSAALAEAILPLVQEEMRATPTKMDAFVERWFADAWMGPMKVMHAMKHPGDMPPDPDSPLGQLLQEKLAKWKAVLDTVTGVKPVAPVPIRPEVAAIVAARKAESAQEAEVMEALLGDDEFIETEARRRFAEQRRENKIRERVAALFRAS